MNDLAIFISTGVGLGMLLRIVVDGIGSVWMLLDGLIRSI